MNNELTYLKMQDDLVNESQLLTEQADCHSQAMRKILTEKEATLSSLRHELERVTRERDGLLQAREKTPVVEDITRERDGLLQGRERAPVVEDITWERDGLLQARERATVVEDIKRERDGLLQGRERAPVVEQVLQERERAHIVRQVTQDKDRRVITPRQDAIQQGRERAPVSGHNVFPQARERTPVSGEDLFPQSRERAPVDKQEVRNPGLYSSCDQKQVGIQNPREVTPPQPMYDVEISQLQSVLEEKQSHLEEKERQDFVFISRITTFD